MALGVLRNCARCAVHDARSADEEKRQSAPAKKAVKSWSL